ncbi:MAG: DUF1214 domain-containing protein [Proteobacteria bacterium]|nr:DUF1214 domain-containing protein [Pseudomonadota bacterium]
MKLALKIAATLGGGIALGLLATWLIAIRGGMPGGVTDGPWHTSLSIGSASGDIYTRASVAVHGLLALNRSETIYYTAFADDEGNALSGTCTYRVSGNDPDARWWSITAYASDDYLIPNPAERYSISKNAVRREMGGGFIAAVGPEVVAKNWIPVTAGNPFSLTLRLYNPGPGVVSDPVHAQLPSIEKVSC